MPKASPAVRAFNAGEFSPLLAGRTDLDRYGASMRHMFNMVSTPQGPALARSGTVFAAVQADEEYASILTPFIRSNETGICLEFGEDRIRFHTDDGLQVYDAVEGLVVSSSGAALNIDAPGLDAAVGDQVSIQAEFQNEGLNGAVATVTSIASDVYTFNIDTPSTGVSQVTLNRVYHVPSTYTIEQREDLYTEQSVDVLYLFAENVAPKKLTRYDDYDWRLEDVEFIDGPFLPTNETSTALSPSTTGNPIPNMTDNTTPSGTATGVGNRPAVAGSGGSPVDFLGRDISYELEASEFYYAFDEDDSTYWAPNTEQAGIIQYNPDTAFACDGYTIYIAKDNQDTSYGSKDYAPSTFMFEGFDGTDWIVLDEHIDYVLYDGGRSVFFAVDNDVAYQRYRLRIQNLTRNGLIEPRVRRLVLRDGGNLGITFTASSTTGINGDTGFAATDVGRLLRVQGSDGGWRSLKITTVTDTLTIVADLQGEPLIDAKDIRRWRLGYWSDTTGWPSMALFFEDRLWMFGSTTYPDMFAGSVPSAYEVFSQTDTFGEVLDDSALVERTNARKLSKIRWAEGDTRGMLIGTGSGEFILTSTDQANITPLNRKLRPATHRGSARVRPVRVDNEVVYVQRSARGVRSIGFVFESDGFKSPSLSKLASHLTAKQIVEMDYAAEPHSVIWARRGDNSLVGLTYDTDENVIGWHQHDFEGAEVESMAVVPQKDQLQDALWMAMKRTVNGVERRYIERLTRVWDFELTLEKDAHFVDSGLRYEGVETTDIYGMDHLVGETVYGLASGTVVGPLEVEEGGKVCLPVSATWAVLGLGYEALGYLPKPEAGAADGTAQGKIKRVHHAAIGVWDSFGGEVGVYNEQAGEYVYEPLIYERHFSEFEDIELFTGVIANIQPTPGYDLDGLIAFRKPVNSPLPFNPVAVYSQLHTQDR